MQHFSAGVHLLALVLWGHRAGMGTGAQGYDAHAAYIRSLHFRTPGKTGFEVLDVDIENLSWGCQG